MTAGRFFLPALPVGELHPHGRALRVSPVHPAEDSPCRVGQKIELPVTLQIGQLSDAVTVTSEAPLLRTVNAEIAEVIDNRQVQELPLNGRQFIQLAQLTDGVTIPPGGTRGAALGQAGPLPNVYGQRGGHNIYLIDGVKVTDELFNNLVISPSVDAIQEFKIQKTMYPAEFGGKASALINVVTKSGGNGFHGSALEFVRNEKFDAHNYFDDRDQADAAASPEPVRRQRRRPAQARSDVLLLQLRRTADPARRRRRPFRCRRRRCAAAISPDSAALCDPLTRTAAGLHAVCRQSDSGAPDQPGRVRRCWPRCRCRRAVAWSRIFSGWKTR